MTNIRINCTNEQEYKEGTDNLKTRGFKLIDQTFANDLWEKENTRFWIEKNW